MVFCDQSIIGCCVAETFADVGEFRNLFRRWLPIRRNHSIVSGIYHSITLAWFLAAGRSIDGLNIDVLHRVWRRSHVRFENRFLEWVRLTTTRSINSILLSLAASGDYRGHGEQAIPFWIIWMRESSAPIISGKPVTSSWQWYPQHCQERL